MKIFFGSIFLLIAVISGIDAILLHDLSNYGSSSYDYEDSVPSSS